MKGVFELDGIWVGVMGKGRRCRSNQFDTAIREGGDEDEEEAGKICQRGLQMIVSPRRRVSNASTHGSRSSLVSPSYTSDLGHSAEWYQRQHFVLYVVR